MSFKSFATKGFSIAMNGKCNKYSKKASSSAKKASNYFRSAKSKKGDQKIDAMIDGMNELSNAVLQVSDSVVPIANMNAVSALLAENIEKLIDEGNNKVINNLK